MRVTLYGFMWIEFFGEIWDETDMAGGGGICREGSVGRSNGWSGKEKFRLISHWRRPAHSTGVSVSFGPRKGSREAPSALQSAPGRGARQVAGPAPLREHPNDQPFKKNSA